MTSNEFDRTPSFYSNVDTFERYLGQTSYYLSLQANVMKLVRLSGAKRVLELGSGTGATAIALAAADPYLEVVSVDMRQSMVALARTEAENRRLRNLVFVADDMRDVSVEGYDFIVMLYSFHHIPDPISNKTSFLRNTYDHLQANARLCIAETFLPDARDDIELIAETRRLWSARIYEGYASTFWSSLQGLTAESISRSRDIGRFSLEHEAIAGENVVKREDEYLVDMNWVTTNAAAVGFQVQIAERVNAIGDGIVLLER
jgi:ubiquinone/menaquinone biosynthesis C-methylase UbiE